MTEFDGLPVVDGAADAAIRVLSDNDWFARADIDARDLYDIVFTLAEAGVLTTAPSNTDTDDNN